MDCLVMPVSMLRKKSLRSRLGYQPLYKDQEQQKSPVTVIVGKEKREFIVDPFVLEEFPFRALIKMDIKEDVFHGVKDRVFLLDLDAILFEHLLWLMENDWSSLLQLNLQDIIDFYAQDC